MNFQHRAASRALGLRVRELRERQRLSARDLARRAGGYDSHIARIERGDANPSLATLVRIAAALGTSVADLVRDIR